METKQVNSLLLRTVLNSCLVFSQVNMYRLYVTFILVQPFTVKHGNELLNSSPKQFAIIMAAKWPGLGLELQKLSLSKQGCKLPQFYLHEDKKSFSYQWPHT